MPDTPRPFVAACVQMRSTRDPAVNCRPSRRCVVGVLCRRLARPGARAGCCGCGRVRPPAAGVRVGESCRLWPLLLPERPGRGEEDILLELHRFPLQPPPRSPQGRRQHHARPPLAPPIPSASSRKAAILARSSGRRKRPRRVGSALRARGIRHALTRPGQLPEGDPLKAFRAASRAFTVGRRLWIDPGDPSDAEPARSSAGSRFALPASRAFGTGRARVDAARATSSPSGVSRDARSSTWGPAQGVLALASAALGARAAFGLDTDAEAVFVARGTCVATGSAGGCTCTPARSPRRREPVRPGARQHARRGGAPGSTGGSWRAPAGAALVVLSGAHAGAGAGRARADADRTLEARRAPGGKGVWDMSLPRARFVVIVALPAAGEGTFRLEGPP